MANRFRNGFESGRETRNNIIEAAYAAHPTPGKDFKLMKFFSGKVPGCWLFYQHQAAAAGLKIYTDTFDVPDDARENLRNRCDMQLRKCSTIKLVIKPD
ncbi:hypothetical protein Tco_1129073 [Tanacetum coccineum]